MTYGHNLAIGADMSKYRLPLNAAHQSALAKAAAKNKRSQVKELECILDGHFERTTEKPLGVVKTSKGDFKVVM